MGSGQGFNSSPEFFRLGFNLVVNVYAQLQSAFIQSGNLFGCVCDDIFTFVRASISSFV